MRYPFKPSLFSTILHIRLPPFAKQLCSFAKPTLLLLPCRGETWVPAYANQDIFNKCGSHVHIQIHFKINKKNIIILYINIIAYSISAQLICILTFIFKETCDTENVTFHGYFYCVKSNFDRSKGNKFLGLMTHLRFMRI